MGNLRNDFPTYISTSIKTPIEEINKLKQYGLAIMFYDYPEGYYDNIGGYHDCAEGWNPNGVWCGECTSISCAKCPNKEAKETDILENK